MRTVMRSKVTRVKNPLTHWQRIPQFGAWMGPKLKRGLDPDYLGQGPDTRKQWVISLESFMWKFMLLTSVCRGTLTGDIQGKTSQFCEITKLPSMLLSFSTN